MIKTHTYKQTYIHACTQYLNMHVSTYKEPVHDEPCCLWQALATSKMWRGPTGSSGGCCTCSLVANWANRTWHCSATVQLQIGAAFDGSLGVSIVSAVECIMQSSSHAAVYFGILHLLRCFRVFVHCWPFQTWYEPFTQAMLKRHGAYTISVCLGEYGSLSESLDYDSTKKWVFLCFQECREWCKNRYIYIYNIYMCQDPFRLPGNVWLSTPLQSTCVRLVANLTQYEGDLAWSCLCYDIN